VIDLRSDWVAPPTDEMWEAMRTASEESVVRLESVAASLLGKEAAVWTPTCSMANLVALMALADPGDRVAVDEDAHILTTEGMGIEHVAGLVPVALDDGASARVICLENTHTRRGGTVLGIEETNRLAAAAPRVHLDGARLPNAAAALGVPLAALAAAADTVAMSLNKALSAPFGAVLAGAADVIGEAREALRRVGGASVHKAGIAAAAGLVALERMLDRLPEDHRRAGRLAARLAEIAGVSVEAVETNIVLFAAEANDADGLLRGLAARGVLGYRRDERRVRFVTHRLIDDVAVERAVAAVADVLDD
jgi:threonine aldolase